MTLTQPADLWNPFIQLSYISYCVYTLLMSICIFYRNSQPYWTFCWSYVHTR